MATINWLAVAVATLSAFALGAVWYAPPVFGNKWMKANKFVKEEMKGHHPGLVFGLAFVLTFIVTLAMHVFLLNHVIQPGLHTALLTGFGFGLAACCGIAIVSLFEGRSGTYVLINGGYLLIAMVLIGAIIGAWL